MEEEVWKDIAGYEGIYQVSNLGRVRSLDRYVQHRYGGPAFRAGKILVPAKGNEPYYHVMLSKENSVRPKRIHRLVAEAFVDNPNGFDCVDHIDCNKLNNRADNLRWCTRAQNVHYAIENGLCYTVPYAQRTPEQQRRYSQSRRKTIVRSDGKVYECTAHAAEDLGVSYSTISAILRGRKESYKGFSFQYA